MVGHIGFTEDRVGAHLFQRGEKWDTMVSRRLGVVHSGFKKIRGGAQWFQED